MGHLVGKDVYKKLGQKLERIEFKAKWNNTLYTILKELYTPEEAELIVKLPYGFSDIDSIHRSTKYEITRLKAMLDTLCDKGLVMDVNINGQYLYGISPILVGFFECTMMRVGDNLNTKEWARLFHEYLSGDDTFYKANFGNGEILGMMRTLPHNEAIDTSNYVEILAYENAEAILHEHDKFACGICSCRHEKLHAGAKKCDYPLDTCLSFGAMADLMIRRNFAKEISKSEAREKLLQSRDLGLVFIAENVKKQTAYICQCCGCCCNVLTGLNVHGYQNAVVTSSYIAQVSAANCNGCGKCVKACPVNAIKLSENEADGKNKRTAIVDKSICIGCGVCGLKCNFKAILLIKRDKEVLVPETFFEKIILTALERGTLQYQLFNDPARLNHQFMRGIIGAFLRLPAVKKGLMSDNLRSKFLGWVNEQAQKQAQKQAQQQVASSTK